MNELTYTIGITPSTGGSAVVHEGNSKDTALEALRDATDAFAVYGRASKGDRSIDVASDGATSVTEAINELRAWFDEQA